MKRETIDDATETVMLDRVFNPISANLFVRSVRFKPYVFIISISSNIPTIDMPAYRPVPL